MIKFNCPTCNHSLISEEKAASIGVVCPQCSTGFVPEKFDFAEPAPAPSVSKRPTRADSIRNTADNFSACATILIILGIVALLGAFFTGSFMAGYIGASLFATAFWSYLVAQVIHIRANTEK